jgi:hypothetical protein
MKAVEVVKEVEVVEGVVEVVVVEVVVVEVAVVEVWGAVEVV